MNKKTYLFILIALAAGTLAGYTGSILTSGVPQDNEKQASPGVIARPRFGNTRSDVSMATSRQSTSSHAGKSEMAKLDDTLKQYARMNAEELWNELEELNKQKHRYLYSPNTTRETLISYIVTRLGQEAPRQTLAQMKNNKGLKQYQYSILEIWGGKNPEAALAYCRENMEENPENDSSWKNSYISLLTETSPDKAIEYLSTLTPEECAENSVEILGRIASQSPEKMTKLMERLGPVMKRQIGIDGYIASTWAKSDWDAAEQWIKTLPEENRALLLGSAASALPREEALKKINMLNEKEKLQALTKLSDSLSWKSPVEAVELILNNTTEEQALKILDRNYYSLNLQDSETNSYLNNMPRGAVKDILLEKIISRQSSSHSNSSFFNPKMEDTFSLINQLDSSEKKEKATESALDNWMHREPEKVKSWVEQSRWPEEKKNQFIKWCNNIIEVRKEDEQS